MSNRPYKERRADFYSIVEKARAMGIPHPEVIAAQWAVESDWGGKPTGKNNYFGIKAGNGDPNNDVPGTVSWTHEVVNGKPQRVQQKFADYETMDDAIRARGAFTATPGGRYEQAGYHTAQSPAQAIQALQKAGYATSPSYNKLLIDSMRGMGVDPNKVYEANRPKTQKDEYAAAFNVPQS